MKQKSNQSTNGEKSPRNKGGRPKKSPDELNSETFLLYLTPTELNQLTRLHQQETKLRKVSLNQFIKDCIFKSKSTSHTKFPANVSDELVNKILVTLLRVDLNLSRFTGNFNQSTKRLNSLMATAQLKAEIHNHADLLHEIGAQKLDIKSIIARLKLFFS